MFAVVSDEPGSFKNQSGNFGSFHRVDGFRPVPYGVVIVVQPGKEHYERDILMVEAALVASIQEFVAIHQDFEPDILVFSFGNFSKVGR